MAQSAVPPTVPATPRPAATVVLVRRGGERLEVLLTRRPATMAFAPDVHVFPGGAVDAADRDPRLVARSALGPDAAAAALAGDAAPDVALGAHVAAVRELFEEAGVLLAEPAAAHGPQPADADLAAARAALLAGTASIADVAESLDLVLRTDLLVPLSRWVTPVFVPRRFDTRFFTAELPPGAAPSFVGEEVIDHRWMAPGEALEALAAGEIGLWLPTSTTLQQLAHVVAFHEVRERLGPGPAAPMRLVEDAPSLVRLVPSAAGAVPGQTVNTWLVGRHDLVVIDPGDPSETAVDAALEVARARNGRIAAVVLTHADPDHAAGAEAIAGRLGVPVFVGPGAGRLLPFETAALADGDRIDAGDVELVAVETPGHRLDHIALLDAADGIALTGDLIGPGPSRSILGPPDIPAWLDALDRLAALAPRRILPGHGEPPSDASAAIERQRRRLVARLDAS